tara:strand:- start:529 stop:897 length:369 start_codon:yes stop_codon:yes gene_type:complete
METRVWWIEDNRIWIKNYSDGVFTKLSEVANVKVWGTLLDGDFKSADTGSGTEVGMLESPAFPEEFHMALVYNVLESLYANKPETLQVAQYWDMKYQKTIIDAKKRKNSIQGGSTVIKGAEF